MIANFIFLGVFFVVVGVILTTLLIAVYRMNRDIRELKVDAIRWKSEFHDLSAVERVCRHQFTGEFKQRTCELGFECGQCPTHAKLIAQHPPQSAGDTNIGGLEMPGDRLYHRGHTWVRPEADGLVSVGLDALGSRLAGAPDAVELPQPGERLRVNGPAWTMRRGGCSVRVLSPVDGVVAETGGSGQEFYLKLRAVTGAVETGHLLRGAEIAPWISRELERLQILLAPAGAGASLADGGVPVDDMPAAMPEADWDAIWGRMFLEP